MMLQVIRVLLAIALATNVLALPKATTSGRTIPLSKRNLHKRADGSVNADVLRTSLTRAVNKFNRGFSAFEKNTGAAHRLAEGAKAAFVKRHNEALTDVQEDLWFGTISVGTPPVQFTVDFDTGSSDTFLPAINCDSSCAGHTLWDPSTSSTAVNTTAPYSLAFGDGSTVSGIVFTDTMTVAGVTATGQGVGASTTYSTGFEASQFPPDGLAGMAFPALSVFGLPDFFSTMVQEGAVTTPEFGFKLTDTGAELFVGGVNPALFTGAFTQVPIVQDAFWEVALTGISINGRLLLSGNVPAIVDTGTTLVIGDPQSVTTMYANIRGSKDASAVLGPGFFTVPCNAVPTVAITMGGVALPISPSTFNLGQLFVGGADCVGGIVGMDIGFWVVGDVFLRSWYTAFNQGTNTVGFAKLA